MNDFEHKQVLNVSFFQDRLFISMYHFIGMIINTGQRTDIVAFYSKWFLRRLEEGFVDVRNPYYESIVTRYLLDPDVVDCLAFCTKNPRPMIAYLDKLTKFKGIHWSVTLTPYGRDIEPFVFDKRGVLESMKELSRVFGPDCVFWRYDPIIVNERYSIKQHLDSFKVVCGLLQGYIHTVIVSFVDTFPHVMKRYVELRPVTHLEKETLVPSLVSIAKEHGIRVRMCHEGHEWESYGADCAGCFLKEDIEKAIRRPLKVPSSVKGAREGCSCLLSGDIGAYDSCLHLCRYCYANHDDEKVRRNANQHNVNSTMLLGALRPGDELKMAKQRSWIID